MEPHATVCPDNVFVYLDIVGICKYLLSYYENSIRVKIIFIDVKRLVHHGSLDMSVIIRAPVTD